METHGLNFREIHMDVKMKEKLQALLAKTQLTWNQIKTWEEVDLPQKDSFPLAPNSTLE